MKIKTRNILIKVYGRIVPRVLNRHIRKIYFNLEWWYHRAKWFCLYGTTDYFNGVAIEISTYCQLRCSICPNSVYGRGLKKNKVEMGLNDINKILTDLEGFRGKITYHRFNEPLTDKRLNSIVWMTKTILPGCKVAIASNGLLLTQEKYNRLKEVGVDEILVTIYDKPVKRIKGVIYRHLDKNSPLLNRGGIIKVQNRADLPCQRAVDYSVNIDVNGNVLKCCNDYFSTEVMGNTKADHLKKIWFSKRYIKERKLLKKKSYAHSKLCKECV